MKRTIPAFVLVLISSPSWLLAGSTPVPGLVGEYDGESPPRIVVVEFGQALDGISDMTLELEGMFDTSWVTTEGGSAELCADFEASFLEPDPGFWQAAVISLDREGDFQATVPFSSLFGATWEFLADGVGELTFEFAPCGITGGAAPKTQTGPIGAVYSAILVYDDAVAEARVPFAGIKAMYR